MVHRFEVELTPPNEWGIRMALIREPVAPRDALRLSLGRLEPQWEAYL